MEHLAVQVKVLREEEMWGGIWADFLEEETLAKVWPRGDGEECILEGRNCIMSETPETRNWGTTQKRGRDVEGEQSGFREKAMSSFYMCYF